MALTANRAMLCEDILDVVFSHLAIEWLPNFPGEDDDLDRMANRKELQKTLAAAATVCRAFSHFALRELWMSLYDIAPLVRLLPRIHADEPGCLVSRFKLSQPSVFARLTRNMLACR